MPANLPPEYIEAEQRYRNASEKDEKLDALQEMLSLLPNHKGTDKIEADLRKRISDLKKRPQKKKGPTRAKTPDQIEPQGAGQVVLTGLPNSGKSALLDITTNATPKVADFPFATHGPTIGMLEHQDIQIQLIDTPPISDEHVETWVYNLIRKADLVLLLVDGGADDPVKEYEKTIKLLEEEGIYLFAPGDDFQRDAIGRTNRKGVMILSKSDELEDESVIQELEELSGLSPVPVSILDEESLSRFSSSVFDGLQKIRIYTKKPGEEPDLKEPYLLDKNSTVLEGVRSIHRNMVDNLDYIRIWGSGRFDGQEVAQDHQLKDGDVIEIHQE
ncbi:50S ribosome-binding GTPase [Candidatus Bipolaricaulota bacterium]|nr:50S ribosome-binding GTPase [Candidatus Bipolaricaulota bacterium]